MTTAEEHEKRMNEKYSVNTQGDKGTPKVSSLVCPKYYGLECKVCDLTYAYYQAKLGKEHYLREKARNLNRKLRYYSNVLFPANPSEPVLFEYGDVIHKMLFGFFRDQDSEYKGFTDPIKGRNSVIKKSIPGGNKRLTDYFVEMKAQVTQIPDLSVLQKMHNLDKVVELIETGKVKPYYQSQLPEGRTEIRILPSWLGPKFTVFYVEVPIHYISKEEYDAISSGRVNPFAAVGVSVVTPPQEVVAQTGPWSPAPSNIPAPSQPSSNPPTWGPEGDVTWGPVPHPAYTSTLPPHNTDAEEEKWKLSSDDLICIGSYDPHSPLCTTRCATLGFLDRCKQITADKHKPNEADQKALRETASRLYK